MNNLQKELLTPILSVKGPNSLNLTNRKKESEKISKENELIAKKISSRLIFQDSLINYLSENLRLTCIKLKCAI